MGEAAIAALKIVTQAVERLAREEAMAGDVISSWDKLLAYCRMTMAHQKIEQFRLLFLDKRNRLIADEVQQQGTIDHTPVRSEEHTSELQSLIRLSYAVFCSKKKKINKEHK